MRNLIVAFALMASPALATGIEIDVTGRANGTIKIDLYEDIAPAHAERIAKLAKEGAYDGVAFHRVIGGFMAQTGDVQFGKVDGGNMANAGSGGSKYPDLKSEFSNKPFVRGTVGMARSNSVNSANSQFFIMFRSNPGLDGNYTVVGEVTEGMDIVDQIKKGSSSANGAISGKPDVMAKVRVTD